MTNAEVGRVLEEIADLLDIKGESAFKVTAYRRAAETVARSPVDLAEAYRDGRPPLMRGIGPSLSGRIEELVRTGRLGYLESLREEVPTSLLTLLAVPGVGPRTVGEAWRTLGIATLPEFEAAARSGRLQEVRGISARTEARILEGIGELEHRPPRRMRMHDAHALAAQVAALLETLPGVVSATVAGSVRRGCETVGDIDVLIETDEPGPVIEALSSLPMVERVGGGLRGGADRVSVQLDGGPQLDVLTMPVGRTGSYLVHLTGSAAHNVALRHRARAQGWSLSEHGLAPLAGQDGAAGRDDQADGGADSTALRTFASEAEVYAALGLAAIPPELREDRGEIEAAAEDRLPRLVELADLRGDCHSHSHWSDGREPLEVMVESARREGREYQVLTDHSVSLAIARGLSPERVEEQRRVIGQLNERFARELAAGELPDGARATGFRLLHGVELEITVDGRLDFEPALLASLDVVVASLHVGRRQPRAQLMARYERAMRDPNVDIISHPSGRKIGQRPDLDLDWDAFYRLAAETGTLLEINGSPARLDLDEHRIRAAIEAGCRFTIDSDAHERSEWQHLAWGTAIARRGWVTRDLVANALPLDSFLALLRDRSWPAVV